MKWPLNDSNFTWTDRFKICSFFLKPKNFWTMSDQVAAFEEKMAKFTNNKYAIFVSSGSTANTLIAMYLKDRFYLPEKNIVVFPSTTWITSVSPFLREGFKPHFIDVNLTNLSIDLNSLEEFLKDNYNKVASVFITSLLGFSPDISRLLHIKNKYKVNIMLDNCESTLTEYNKHNISSYFTSTTSTYFGHQLQSVEGGFIFTNNKEEYDYFLMARNHGMVRSLKTQECKDKYRNVEVDARFDFNLLGNNFRNTDINAYIGQLDFARIYSYSDKRINLYKRYEELARNIPSLHIVYMQKEPNKDVPFSIPLIFKESRVKDTIEKYVLSNNIETRPIISGNLLRQTCLKGRNSPINYKNSELLHNNGFYIGLHNKVTLRQIEKLISLIEYKLNL